MSVRRIEAGERVVGLQPVGCESCERTFLARFEDVPCPLCGGGPVKRRPVVARDGEPERIVPFDRAPDPEILREFAGIWFRTSDLTAENLVARAARVWWPVWLVDATCDGAFAAEVGFDYQTRSTEEAYEDGQWRTREVMRDKVRWEPRVGAVRRRYDNVAVPALTEHARRIEALGAYDVGSVPFDPSLLADGWVQLPDVTPDEAWPDAEVGLARRVGEDVKAAIDVPHVRGVTVQARYEDVVSTWLLWPMYASWYVDDAGTRHAVWIHPRTGVAHGKRMASVRKGIVWGAVLGSVGVSVLVAAGLCALIGVVLWPLLAVAAVLAVIAVPLCALALWPPMSAWSNNRRQG